VGGKIVLEEDPGPADFGAGDNAGFHTAPELLWMAAHESSGFLEA
jgi:hypothetical protein